MSRQMQITQIEAYTKNTAKFNRKEQEMLNFYQANPNRSYTDVMLSELLGWKLSCICGRRNSLVKKDKLEKAGRIRNPETGISNILWRLKR